MMRSLFAGVSGLQNHQTRMDVVGNNIANVNTYGFKRGRVTFKDMISQSLSGAAKPQEDRGGINPQQVGLGMMVATIDTIHTQGALQVTGVNTDLAIQGEGFFIEKRGNNSYYTRNGAFSLDRDGYLVNPSIGYKVQGWNAVLNEETGRLYSIPGNVPNPINMPNHCYFKNRCEMCKEQCDSPYPALRRVSETHYVACHLYDDIDKK